MQNLQAIREQLDEVDKSILILLSVRRHLASEIAVVKKHLCMDVVQQDVFENQLHKRLKENESFQLDPKFIYEVFALLHKESVKIQTNNNDL